MKRNGFTLVEVLIASVILFAAIGIASVAFQSGTKTMSSAAETSLLLRPLPLLLDEIEQSLRGVPIQSHKKVGVVLGVQYQWSAEPATRFAPPARFDPDKSEYIEYEERFALYNVTLTLMYQRKQKKYDFQKLGWSEALVPKAVGDVNAQGR